MPNQELQNKDDSLNNEDQVMTLSDLSNQINENEEVVVENIDAKDNEKKQLINKRINLKVVDPTLPVVNYKIQKRYLLSFGDKKNAKGFLSSAKDKIAETVNSTKNEIKNSKSGFMSFLIGLFIVVIVGMSVYGIVDAIVVYAQWNYLLYGSASPLVVGDASATYVQNWVPIFFYQYFISTKDGLYVGVPTLANGTDMTSFVQSCSNFSLSGLGAFSVAKFNWVMTGNIDVLKSSVGGQIFYSFLIQICYSLFGLLLALCLRFCPSNKKSAVTWISIFVCSLWIIA